MRNIEDQMKVVRANTDVSCHKFFNIIAMAIKKKMEEDIPGLVLQFGGKSAKGAQISAHLAGKMIDEDGNAADKARMAMDSLKNPANLFSAMKRV